MKSFSFIGAFVAAAHNINTTLVAVRIVTASVGLVQSFNQMILLAQFHPSC